MLFCVSVWQFTLQDMDSYRYVFLSNTYDELWDAHEVNKKVYILELSAQYREYETEDFIKSDLRSLFLALQNFASLVKSTSPHESFSKAMFFKFTLTYVLESTDW